jgi:hypothetical protein
VDLIEFISDSLLVLLELLDHLEDTLALKPAW